MKLTKTQAAALKTIAENPGRVIAWNRTQADFIRINGNTENKLFQLGLIEAVSVGERTYQGHTFELKVWKLTEAATVEADPHAATRAEGRKMGMTEAQIDRFIARMGG